jgi:hypothetical protein
LRGSRSRSRRADRKPHPRRAVGWAALGLLAIAAPLGAQDAPERRRLDEIARVAGQQFIAARAAADSQQTLSTAPLSATQVDLTLQEATTRALERNLELAVERLNPLTFDLNIARIRAAFRPIATSQFGQRSVVQPPTNQLNGGTIVQNDSTTYNAGLTEVGARTRLRPILMTSIATMLGLVPMAIGLGEGGELQAPLARVVIGGLLASTMVTLVLVPAVYTLFEEGLRGLRKSATQA